MKGHYWLGPGAQACSVLGLFSDFAPCVLGCALRPEHTPDLLGSGSTPGCHPIAELLA